MPAVSEKQRRFMAVERAKKRAGKKTKTGMSDAQLSDFMGKSKGSARKAGPGMRKVYS